MKKLWILLVSVFIISQSTNAQFYKGFGMKIGTSIANQQANFSGTPYYKFGLTGGIFRETTIIDKLNLVIGINYSQKGYRWEFVNTSEEGNYLGSDFIHQNINFITSELIVKYDGNKESLTPYILAGLRMDFMVSHNATRNGEDYPIGELINFSGNKVFGGIAGLGLSYKPEKQYSIFLEGTYNPDFTNLIERENNFFKGYIFWMRGNSFELRAGVRF